MELKEQVQQADWPDRITNLAEEVIEVKQWRWYLDQQPAFLAEQLDAKMDQKVTSAKLRGLRRRMVNEGILEE